MRVRWSHGAWEDIQRIFEYIHAENPNAAIKVTRTIYDAAQSLDAFPQRGRPGRVPDSRELILPAIRFTIVYRIQNDTVQIAHVFHDHQQW